MFLLLFFLFFFNDTATTEIYTLSLHDALPICPPGAHRTRYWLSMLTIPTSGEAPNGRRMYLAGRSEEHTSELQSHSDLVCRLLLEKKKKNNNNIYLHKKKKKKTKQQ